MSDKSVGHFQWLLSTHENPGRPMRADGTQIWDGARALDHIGPANNKGLMTLWGEPTDAYYMYRARNIPASTTPMVYIVSHSWPDRWHQPGTQSGIEVYSNCDSVELFNDVGARISLGIRRPDDRERFVLNDVPVRYNRLVARCRMNGLIVAQDMIKLNNLPHAPGEPDSPADALISAPAAGYHYLYRINAGGDRQVDIRNQQWEADRQYEQGRTWGWESWAQTSAGLDPMLGSRRPVFDPVSGSDDPGLFTGLRYGRDALSYRFKTHDGRYRIELYFVEPWYGRSGIDARGWRVFDVAVNGRTVIDDLDIFAEAGFGRALKKNIPSLDVETGAAARMSIRIRFQSSPLARREAKVTLTDSSGIVISSMDMVLEGSGDWKTAEAQTPGLINAGRYRVQVKLAAGPDSATDSIKIE